MSVAHKRMRRKEMYRYNLEHVIALRDNAIARASETQMHAVKQWRSAEDYIQLVLEIEAYRASLQTLKGQQI